MCSNRMNCADSNPLISTAPVSLTGAVFVTARKFPAFHTKRARNDCSREPFVRHAVEGKSGKTGKTGVPTANIRPWRLLQCEMPVSRLP